MAVAATATRVDVKALVLGWVEEYVTAGQSPSVATRNAVQRLKDCGLLDDFLETWALDLISQAWMLQGSYLTRRGRPPTEHPHVVERTPAVQGERRVPPANAPASLLDAAYQIGDAWVRLGDMRLKEVLDVADTLYLTEKRARRSRKFLGKLGDGLTKGQTIRDRYTEADLRVVWASITEEIDL